MKASSYSKSAVMKDVLKRGGDKILKTAGDRQAFWKVLKQEGKGGYTNTKLKNVFGKLMKDNSDRFSSSKVRALSKIFNPHGKSYNLSGGSSSRSSAAPDIKINEKPKTNINEVLREIKDRKVRMNENVKEVDKFRSQGPRQVNFGVSQKNLREIQENYNDTVSAKNNQKSRNNPPKAEYVTGYRENSEEDEVKKKLAALQQNQGNNEKKESKPAAFGKGEKEDTDQKTVNSASNDYFAELHGKKRENTEENTDKDKDAAKKKLAALQRSQENNEINPVPFGDGKKKDADEKTVNSASGVSFADLHGKKRENADKDAAKEKLAEIQGSQDKKKMTENKEDNKKPSEKNLESKTEELQSSSQEKLSSENIKKQYSNYSFQELTREIATEDGFDLRDLGEKGCFLFNDLMDKSEKEIEKYIHDLADDYSSKEEGFEKVKKEKAGILSLFREELISKNKDHGLSENTQLKIKNFIAETERILKIIEKCKIETAEDAKTLSTESQNVSDEEEDSEKMKQAA